MDDETRTRTGTHRATTHETYARGAAAARAAMRAAKERFTTTDSRQPEHPAPTVAADDVDRFGDW